jgi:hypothetical protein
MIFAAKKKKNTDRVDRQIKQKGTVRQESTMISAANKEEKYV